MNRFAVALVAALAATPLAVSPHGAGAQSDGSAAPRGDQPSATDRLQEGAAVIVDGLRMLMDQLQSYQPPEVLPNGDIIIRRRPPEPPEPPATPDAPDGQTDKSLKL